MPRGSGWVGLDGAARQAGCRGLVSIGYVTTGYRRPVFSIRIRRRGLPLSPQGKSRMRECRTYGSVRGVGGNAHPYRDRSRVVERTIIGTVDGSLWSATEIIIRR